MSEIQFRPFGDTISSDLSAGYEKRNDLLEDVDARWLQMAFQLLYLCPKCIFEKQEAVSPFLKCTMIPDGHHAYLFLKKSDMLYLWNMVRMVRVAGRLE